MSTTDTAIRFQVLIERYKASQARLLLKLIRDLENTIEGVLRGVDLSKYPLPQVTKILTLVDQKFSVQSQTGLNTYIRNQRDFVQSQAKVEQEAWGATALSPSDINVVFDVPLGVDGDNRGKTVDVLIVNWWANTRSSLFGYIRRGAFEGKTNAQILQELKGTIRQSHKDGVLDIYRRYSITISNTAIQHIFMAMRELVLRSSATKGVFWNALLEKNTCARCQGLDMTPFSLGKGPRSPLHMGCRCIMVPIMSNTTFPRQSYYEWLKLQDPEFVAEAIGTTRAAVFLDGGISAERFGELQLNKRFDPLTLDELKKLIPSAFKRAGV